MNKSYTYSIICLERDLIIINIIIDNKNYIIINIYVPPSSQLDISLIKLEFYLRKYWNSRLIIAGDLNAKHSLWGLQKIDHRGEILLNFINKYELTILNNPDSLSTYASTLGTSWIDMVFIET